MECCCDEFVQSGAQPTYKLNNVKLEPLSLLLQRYIDNNLERELQCIYALQNFAFVREYPPGKNCSKVRIQKSNQDLIILIFESHDLILSWKIKIIYI